MYVRVYVTMYVRANPFYFFNPYESIDVGIQIRVEDYAYSYFFYVYQFYEMSNECKRDTKWNHVCIWGDGLFILMDLFYFFLFWNIWMEGCMVCHCSIHTHRIKRYLYIYMYAYICTNPIEKIIPLIVFVMIETIPWYHDWLTFDIHGWKNMS